MRPGHTTSHHHSSSFLTITTAHSPWQKIRLPTTHYHYINKMFNMIFVVAIVAIIALFSGSANAFQANPRTSSLVTRPSSVPTSSTLFFFGQPKDDGKPGDYLCKDCGYVFTKGPEAWAKEPEKGTCPPCGAPKFRFKKVPKGSADGKVEVKKSWF